MTGERRPETDQDGVDAATPGTSSPDPAGTPPQRSYKPKDSGWKKLHLVVADAFHFYRKGVPRLKRVIWSQLEGGDPQRDIRIRDEQKYQGVERTRDGWQIALPPVCVVCGTETDEDWQDVTRTVVDDTWPIRLVVSAVFLGIVPGLCLLGWLALPLAVVVGGVSGYRLSSKQKVRLRLRRCVAHRKRQKQPTLHQYAGELVLRFKDPKVKQEFVKQNRSRDAMGSADSAAPKQRRSWVPRWLVQHGAKFAAMIWVAIGVIQLLAAILETVAVFLLIAVIAAAARGEIMPILVLLVLGGGYVAFRLRIGWTFFRTGLDTLRGEARDTIANALGSIGIGVLFALPLWPIINGTWRTLPHADSSQAISLTSFPGLWVPIGFAVNTALLIAAGVLALIGRRGYLETEAEDQTFMFRTSCPVCACPVDVLGHHKMNTLHTCVECGKIFRLEPEETRL